jgi:hypothetical protein
LLKLANTRILEMSFAVAAVVAMASCGNRNVIPVPAAMILEHADHFELLSLDPRPQWEPAEGDFHRYKVLGTAVLEDAETRTKFVTAFKRAVAENQGYEALCFNPRHGIRVTRKGKQVDFVICFGCAQVEVFGEVQGTFLISGSARVLFDRVLQSNGIPLAER